MVDPHPAGGVVARVLRRAADDVALPVAVPAVAEVGDVVGVGAEAGQLGVFVVWVDRVGEGIEPLGDHVGLQAVDGAQGVGRGRLERELDIAEGVLTKVVDQRFDVRGCVQWHLAVLVEDRAGVVKAERDHRRQRQLRVEHRGALWAALSLFAARAFGASWAGLAVVGGAAEGYEGQREQCGGAERFSQISKHHLVLQSGAIGLTPIERAIVRMPL